MKKKLVFFIGGLNFGGMERVVFIAKELLEKETLDDNDVTEIIAKIRGIEFTDKL